MGYLNYCLKSIKVQINDYLFFRLYFSQYLLFGVREVKFNVLVVITKYLVIFIT